MWIKYLSLTDVTSDGKNGGKARGCSIHSATAPLLTACIAVCAAFNGLFAEILIVVLPSPPRRSLHLVPCHGWSYDCRQHCSNTTGGDWSGVSKLGAEYLQALASPASTLLILPPACWLLRILVTGLCTISCWSPWSLNCVVSCNLYFSQ